MVAPFIRSRNWPYGRHLYGLLAVSAILLTGLTFRVAMIGNEPSHGTVALFLIKMTVVLPELVIWLLAARSAKRFKRYAMTIKDGADGHDMNFVANGLLWLTGYVVVLCLLSPIQTLLLYGGHNIYAWTALTNHLPIIPALIAAVYVFVGSRGLAGLTRADFWTRRNTIILLVPFVIFMLAFVADFYLEAPRLQDVNGNLRFALPVQALLFTYVLPHITIWLLGLFSGFNLWWYARHVEGAIYKGLFAQAQRGIVVVFISIFLAQLLICSPYAADNFQLGITLVYVVLLLTVVGYSLIFKGAQQLQNLEDVV